jgi:hypothetical protein
MTFSNVHTLYFESYSSPHHPLFSSHLTVAQPPIASLYFYVLCLFVLDLDSAYERNNAIFDFLS